MERSPLLLEPKSRSVSQTAAAEDLFEFQFPTVIDAVAALPKDIVFCGKVMTCKTRTEPDSSHGRKKASRSQSSNKLRSGRSILSQEKCSESFRRPRNGDSRRHSNGLFGIIKLPERMELSEIKERQSRREPLPLPDFTVDESGELVVINEGKGSRWELVRPMRRRDVLKNALAKASMGCFPLV